jgi:hypothetical protein
MPIRPTSSSSWCVKGEAMRQIEVTAEQVTAARVRVAGDRVLGRETPPWIVKLANTAISGEDAEVAQQGDAGGPIAPREEGIPQTRAGEEDVPRTHAARAAIARETAHRV